MDKAKQKLLDKLGKKGFDTEKKVNAIDMHILSMLFLWMAVTRNRKRGRQNMIEMIEDQETIQNHTTMEVKDLNELRDLINSLPEGTVYSLNLEVIELGQET